MHPSKTLVYTKLFNTIYRSKLIIPSKSFSPLTKGAAVVGHALLGRFLATESPVKRMLVVSMSGS